MLNLLRTKPSADAIEKFAWLRLIRTENVGPVTFYQLIEKFGSAQNALTALPELAAKGGRKKPLVVPPLFVIEKEYDSLRKAGGEIVTAADDAYPIALSSLSDAPPILSYLGNVSLLNRPGIAIVGARNASLNGKRFATSLAHDLGVAGQVVTSGLARGIDTAAHEGALETGTIAVVAGGIDVVYPPENQKLYDAIREKGVIVAESPFGAEPVAQSFPRRNRIVSGLSSGTVVVEATLKSGSLITARLATEQGRDVYAVPGHPMDPRAAGPNHLIREGATLVRSAEDILEFTRTFSGGSVMKDSARNNFRHITPTPAPIIQDDARQVILDTLSHTPVEIDELIRSTGLSVPATQVVLLELELAGRLQRLPGNRVVIISP